MMLMRLLVLLSIPCSAVAFAPASQVSVSRNREVLVSLRASKWPNFFDLSNKAAAAAVTSSLTFLPAGTALAADDLEIAELPPVYVPVLFGVGLLVGVGLLTSSLGNVMDEESSLGMQSGARAKKERDRSRSSYFKK